MLEGAQRMIADLKMDPSRSKRTGADAARSYEVTILKEWPVWSHLPVECLRWLVGGEHGAHRRIPLEDHEPGGWAERSSHGNVSCQDGLHQREVVVGDKSFRTTDQDQRGDDLNWTFHEN